MPDCGEKTYVGSGRLKDRKALVTGGDSGIGRAAAIAYAREGADVAISYLPVEEEDAQDVKKIIEECGRKAVLLPGDVSAASYTHPRAHETLANIACRLLFETKQNQLLTIPQASPLHSLTPLHYPSSSSLHLTASTHRRYSISTPTHIPAIYNS